MWAWVANVPKTVSASEAKTRFGVLLDWAVDHGDDVIVESHGKPKAVIVPFEAYRTMLKLREEPRRRDASDYLLAYAVTGQADHLVTGDDDLLVVGEIENVHVITPDAFRDIIRTT